MESSTICFKKADVTFYSLIILFLVLFFVYIIVNKTEHLSNVNLNSHLSNTELMGKISDLQDKLYNCSVSRQQCETDLIQVKSTLSSSNVRRNILLDRIYDPLQPPERTYSGGRFNTEPYQEFQQIGFLYNNTDRYPLFSRPKYPGKTDKYEYYIIDESRNRLKIPFRSKNDNELYDGDSIFVDILKGEYNVKIYDYDNIRYNPNIL